MNLQYKEAYRLFWMVKGHLEATEDTVLGCADGYFKRLWGNHAIVLVGYDIIDGYFIAKNSFGKN